MNTDAAIIVKRADENTANTASTDTTKKDVAKPASSGQGDFLAGLAQNRIEHDRALRELRRCMVEIGELRSENRWGDIVELFHPVEEKEPLLCDAGIAVRLRCEVAFALGQIDRHEDAIAVYGRCVAEEPGNFMFQSGLAYTAYDSLFAGMSGKVAFHPKERQKRIELAHAHFQSAQKLRPDAVTNYYREGMLYKQIQKKPRKALPLFRTAIDNWRAYSPEKKEERARELKNYVKALYNAASCLLEENPRQALELLSECMEQDSGKDYLSPVHKHFALGKVHFALNGLDEAKSALKAAAALADPQRDDFVFELLARVYLAEKSVSQAYRTVEMVPMHRRRPYFRWTEADVLAALGRTAEAKNVLIKVSRNDRRGKHRALLRLARLEYLGGDLDQCLAYCQQTEEFFREVYQNSCDEALFWRAAAQWKSGAAEDAAQTLAELESFRPSYPNLHRLKALVESDRDRAGEKEGK